MNDMTPQEAERIDFDRYCDMKAVKNAWRNREALRTIIREKGLT